MAGIKYVVSGPAAGSTVTASCTVASSFINTRWRAEEGEKPAFVEVHFVGGGPPIQLQESRRGDWYYTVELTQSRAVVTKRWCSGKFTQFSFPPHKVAMIVNRAADR